MATQKGKDKAIDAAVAEVVKAQQTGNEKKIAAAQDKLNTAQSIVVTEEDPMVDEENGTPLDGDGGDAAPEGGVDTSGAPSDGDAGEAGGDTTPDAGTDAGDTGEVPTEPTV